MEECAMPLESIAPTRELVIQRRLLLVDDDPFSAILRDAGHITICCDHPATALAMLVSGVEIEGCIVDLSMPDVDGLEFVRTLRARDLNIPLMVVTAHSSPVFEEEALELGALDFVDKGRGLGILLHRVARLVSGISRPVEAPIATDLSHGKLKIQGALRRIAWNGSNVPLTRMELEIVHLLASRPGISVSYRDIYDAMKMDGFVAGSGEEGYRANVRAAVKRIRRKFSDIDPSFDALENYPGFGYHWRLHA
jgi:two-component system, OmpR family, response regulator ChvI